MRMDYAIHSEFGDLLIETNYGLHGQIVDMLVAERKAQNKTQQEIADFTGIKRANIARIEGKKHSTSIDVLEKYAECLGKRLDVKLVG